MKFKFLIVFTIFSFLKLNSQISKQLPPCSPGMNIIYSIDSNNDGYCNFDINHYIQFNLRPDLESYYSTNSSGYNITFYNSNNELSESPYTNISLNEECYFKIEYSGSGNVFTHNPCSEDLYLKYRYVQLIAVSTDGDEDNDGILNKDEDSNKNFNLMDDDDDNDGIINLLDSVTLSNVSFNDFKARIYPNPVTNGFINIESDFVVDEMTLYDYTGRIVLNEKVDFNKINLATYPKGTYLIRLKRKNQSQWSKIVIH